MPSNRPSGFTLIELMVVIIVLGVIAAIALPSFKSIIDGRRLVGAADNLHAMLQYARSEAIKQNQNILFHFDTSGWCYGVDDDGADCDCGNPATCTVNGVQKVVDDNDYTNISLAAKVDGSAATSGTITFEPRQGGPSDPAEFQFTTPRNRSKKVIVNSIGLIRVE